MNEPTQTLPPSAVGDAREILKCFYCKLSQFHHESNKCRRCKRCVDGPEVAAPPPTVALLIASTQPLWPVTSPKLLAAVVADVLVECRAAAQLSQRGLAARMGLPRTYISKLENARAFPSLLSLYRLLDAAGVTMFDFTTRVDQRRIMIALHQIATDAGEKDLPQLNPAQPYRAPHSLTGRRRRPPLSGIHSAKPTYAVTASEIADAMAAYQDG